MLTTDRSDIQYWLLTVADHWQSRHSILTIDQCWPLTEQTFNTDYWPVLTTVAKWIAPSQVGLARYSRVNYRMPAVSKVEKAAHFSAHHHHHHHHDHIYHHLSRWCHWQSRWHSILTAFDPGQFWSTDCERFLDSHLVTIWVFLLVRFPRCNYSPCLAVS